MQSADRYLEDFQVGETFESDAFEVSEKESIAFAQIYDPQPFHLDAEQAAQGFFRELTTSGWQTAAITMRLVVDTGILRATGIIGMGIDDLRWLSAVHPGDTLRVRGEIIDKAPWPGKPRGTMRIRLHTINQDGIVVLSQVANVMVPMRKEATP